MPIELPPLPGIPPLPELRLEAEFTDIDKLHGPDMDVIHQALRRGALMGGQFVQGLWVSVAQRLDIRQTGAYIRGIESEGRVEVVGESMTGGGDWEIVIEVTNTAAHASIVEDGHPAFSMVAAIDWSNTSGSIKRGPNGPYLHIPFRHRAYAGPARAARQGLTRATRRAMMPREIYQEAKQLQYRVPQRMGRQTTSSGQFVAADRYKWEHDGKNRRLSRKNASPVFHMGKGGNWTEMRSERFVGRSRGKALTNPAWQSSKYDGLIRSGGRGHTRYITVRTITPNSKGWNIPAQPGHGVARKLASSLQSDRHLHDVIATGIAKAMEPK